MSADTCSLVALNSAPQTLTTTPAKFAGWTSAGQYDNTADQSVVPDLANNRILAQAPSADAGAQATYYRFNFCASAQCGTAGIVKFTLRKGGVAITDCQGQCQFPGTANDIRNVAFTGTVKVNQGDAGIINPTQSPATTGQAGAERQMPFEIYGESSVGGGIAVTVLNACLQAFQVGN
jgi:hypothetical protein